MGALPAAKKAFSSPDAGYRPLWRFGVVGLVNTGLDYLFFLFLVRIGVNYLIAQAASYTMGVINSFLMNRAWTFGNSGRETGDSLLRFLAVNGLSLALSVAGLRALSASGGVSVYLAKIAVTAFPWVIRYLGYKYWAFGMKRPAQSSLPRGG